MEKKGERKEGRKRKGLREGSCAPPETEVWLCHSLKISEIDVNATCQRLYEMYENIVNIITRLSGPLGL